MQSTCSLVEMHNIGKTQWKTKQIRVSAKQKYYLDSSVEAAVRPLYETPGFRNT